MRLTKGPAPAWVRRLGSWLGIGAVTLAGVIVGVLVAGRTTDDIGPFRAQFAVRPSFTGGTEVSIPPLGSLHLQSHYGPAHLTVRLDALDQGRTEAIVRDPDALVAASDGAVEDVSQGVRRLAWRVLGVSVLSAMLAGALVYRSARRVAICGVTALTLVAGSGVAAMATFRAESIQEPRYEGLLTNAPAVVGDARRIAGRYEEYRAQLQRLVANVGRIYGTMTDLPVYSPDTTTTRVLHVSDLHLNPSAWAVVSTVVDQFDIDIVVDTGDINDWGSEPEASYVASIGALGRPYVYVRGNHDSALTAAAVARQPNARVLDGEVISIDGLTIAGVRDPRFTPDKTTDSDADLLKQSGERLADTIRNAGRPVHLALVHDPIIAEPADGLCPVLLAGHRHKRTVELQEKGSLLMVQGSTGGEGLRGLEDDEPAPLTLSVLYFDQTFALQAYDDITVGGTGQAEVSLQRKIIKPEEAPVPAMSHSGSPAPSASASGR